MKIVTALHPAVGRSHARIKEPIGSARGEELLELVQCRCHTLESLVLALADVKLAFANAQLGFCNWIAAALEWRWRVQC